ncbi:MAG TPA: 3-hydroxyacyl-ACP dehydratase FabZ [Vicinamibacterales bacterium]
MTDLSLPLDQHAIHEILPHRYPFLFVDRITTFEPDRRIVGIKAVSLNEATLIRTSCGSGVLPVAVLTEAVAQVGAILVLLKPGNRTRLVFFMGIDRVRFRRPVYAGETVEIEAVVRQLRERMGRFSGTARVDGEVVAEGRMTFALGPPGSR